MELKKPRGTHDVLPSEAGSWQSLEEKVKSVCKRFGFSEIRTPTFEFTELFARGVGDGTDVVQKEMYTFSDRDERSLTLRPEGTASCARAFLENGLYGGNLPLKMFYLISCFRYEKPQAGRMREFHQFGAEVFGTERPEADVEIISLAHVFFKELGICDLELRLNSIGCAKCRAEYKTALIEFLSSREEKLCGMCKERLLKNPMRVLDCKNPACKDAVAGAPSIIEHLCGECFDHFEKTKSGLYNLGIDFIVDPSIVRGLDYYNRTVFEFVSNDIGAQGTVCGGGRYDSLLEQIGSRQCPGLGFAMGIERILLLLQNKGLLENPQNNMDIFLCAMGENAKEKIQAIALKLREKGIKAEYDLLGRSLKAQMKYADKSGARFVSVIGDNELSENKIKLKKMDSGDETETTIDEISDFFVRENR